MIPFPIRKKRQDLSKITLQGSSFSYNRYKNIIPTLKTAGTSVESVLKTNSVCKKAKTRKKFSTEQVNSTSIEEIDFTPKNQIDLTSSKLKKSPRDPVNNLNSIVNQSKSDQRKSLLDNQMDNKARKKGRPKIKSIIIINKNGKYSCKSHLEEDNGNITLQKSSDQAIESIHRNHTSETSHLGIKKLLNATKQKKETKNIINLIPKSSNKSVNTIQNNTHEINSADMKNSSCREENISSSPGLEESAKTIFHPAHFDSPCKDTISPKEKNNKTIKVYHATKNFVGRETELNQLENFIQTHLNNKSSGSLFIYGADGTGKTACMDKILSKFELSAEVEIIYIDCYSMKTVTSIYAEICEDLKLRCDTNKDFKLLIENYLSKPRQMLLLVLHEMDKLDTSSQSELDTFFEWTLRKNFQVVLIGTASSINVMSRVQLKLNEKLDVKHSFQPDLLHFKLY